MKSYKAHIHVLDNTFKLLRKYEEYELLRKLETLRSKTTNELIISSDILDKLVEFISLRATYDFIPNFIINIEGLTQTHINKLLNAYYAVLHRRDIKEHPVFSQKALARI